MTPAVLLALSLGLSVVTAALGWTVMRVLERRVADPVLRERAWAAALHLPALPPLAVSLMFLLPAPVRIAAAPDAAAPPPATVVIELQGSGFPAVDLAEAAALVVLALAGLLALLRMVSLGVRLMRLRRLVRATTAPDPDLRRTVEQAARRLGVTVPTVRIGGAGAEALLAGLLRPVLVLPAGLAADPDSTPTRAVCAHELAHLKRGDHRALWIEEALLAALAINPLLRVIRDHRAAAREEACDAAALAGAGAEHRRLYARSLLEAVRDTSFQRTAPALTFTSARRTFVMNRLKAILAPASPAGPRSRRMAVGLVALIAGVAGAGSLAVAAQRQPVVAPQPTEVAVSGLPAKTAAPAARPEPVFTPAPAEQTAPVQSPGLAPVIVPQRVPTEASGTLAVEDQPGEISQVTWAQYPTPMFPTVAASNGVRDGRVTLLCTVEADGRASGCAIQSETPEGEGFGEAALASMETARFSPRLLEGATPGGRARFTIRFRVAD